MMIGLNLEEAAKEVVRRADLFPHLEAIAVDVVEASKREDLASLGVAIRDLEDYLMEVLGFTYCETCRSVKRLASGTICC